MTMLLRYRPKVPKPPNFMVFPKCVAEYLWNVETQWEKYGLIDLEFSNNANHYLLCSCKSCKRFPEHDMFSK